MIDGIIMVDIGYNNLSIASQQVTKVDGTFVLEYKKNFLANNMVRLETYFAKKFFFDLKNFHMVNIIGSSLEPSISPMSPNYLTR